MKTFVYAYTSAATSGQALAKSLNATFVHPGDPVPAADLCSSSTVIINWGHGDLVVPPGPHVLNPADAIARAVNKTSAFTAFRENAVPHPSFTRSRATALGWLAAAPSRPIYCRTRVSGADGAGLVVARNASELVEAPLYTQGFTGQIDEYRATVFHDTVTTLQLKVVVSGRQGSANQDVRTTAGGWGFDVFDVRSRPAAIPIAIRAVQSLGLDFGGVDLLRVTENGQESWYVLEVNTAPTLTPYACSKLSRVMSRYINEEIEIEEEINEEPADESLRFVITAAERAAYRDKIE